MPTPPVTPPHPAVLATGGRMRTPERAAGESSSGVVSSLQLKPAAPDSRRRLIIALFIVAGIAATHVGATQASQYCVLNGVPPFFSMWFSTGWNVLLALPLLRPNTRARPAPSVLEPRSEGHAWAWPTRFVWRVVPFYSLWAGANTLYVAALGRITSSLTTALFSVTPALVVLLAVPLLGRRLTLFSMLACALAAGGVTLIAQPWREDGGGAAISVAGMACVLGAAACAAAYKARCQLRHTPPPPLPLHPCPSTAAPSGPLQATLRRPPRPLRPRHARRAGRLVPQPR